MEGVGVASGGGGGGGEEQGEKMKLVEGEIKTNKRKMKTASQLEILEKTYAVETYPSDTLRAELSVQLGLSDRQLQMWFCHRRLKDRKPPSAKRPRKDSPPPVAVPVEEAMPVGGQVRNAHVPQSIPFGHGIDRQRLLARPSGVAVPRISIAGDFPATKRHYKPQQSIAELRAIAFVEAQLGEPLREDGPILGIDFDPLPPGAFGAPIGAVGQQKEPGIPSEANIYELPGARPIERLHEYQFLPEQPTVRGNAYERVATSLHYNSPANSHNTRTAALTTFSPFAQANGEGHLGSGFPSWEPSLSHMPKEGKLGHILPFAARDYETVPPKVPFTNVSMDAQFSAHSFDPFDNPSISTDRPFTHSGDIQHMERKFKGEGARIVREVEAHEKRIQKELEKQDILRRKREEQMRKEMEKHDRERRKEEERLSREKQRDEERYQREQRRELERREKFLQRESIRAEKMRQKEELRREKEAARQKAASERAVARRIAKESMELVEDERLELMEFAASSKGLPSVLSLDLETLQNLDLYRDKLNVFPPKSVLLKKPFAIQPWRDSDENVGNLLMVWRFLVTFADVLAIWPFTLDEFVQAFHDYDPRLLGEIHVALLRCIIKDIEDVARTPASGLGTNQNCAANSGGGHPQIIEGAYMWGFDIRSWKHHLNPLTWPEILRQFALSAGFGPQLKNKDIDQAYSRGDNEGNDGEDVVSILRSGAAVENAVALMQERGFSISRRSRHRLTPGTVKFAAFHVLSLQGEKGLTILEVADKIQKSGLRDLTTSKTPEASVSAALSRDTKLFERTAPSTYCVRPAYRKNPEDAKEILSAAREKIRMFKSGFADGEGADDAERDDSETDGAEDPEVDDLGTDLKSLKQAHNSPEANDISAKALIGNGKKSDELNETPQVCLQNVSEVFSSLLSEGEAKAFNASIDQSVDVANVCTNLEQEDADIDESNPGEPWVQGLMEAEYSDLTVEERLNALIALVGVAIEGTSIRVVLEERLEAANALKKQMWAEAQLDKRRMKEECVTKSYHLSVVGNKMESNLMMPNADCTEIPFVIVADKSNGVSVNTSVQREQLSELQSNIDDLNNMPSEGNFQMQDLSTSLDNLSFQQLGYAAERSRSQLKSLIGNRAEEIYAYRSLPLGQDRRHNRYWQFATSASYHDPGCGRIFVELQGGQWRLIDSEEGFDALVESLDVRGSRESHLYSMLQKIEISFKETARRNTVQASTELQNEDIVKSGTVVQAVGCDCTGGIDGLDTSICVVDSDIPEASTSFAVELGRNETEKIRALWRYQDFEKWMWKECFNSSVPYARKREKKRCMPLLGICDYCYSINFLEDSRCPSCYRMYDASGSNMNIFAHMAHCVEKLTMDVGTTLSGSSFPSRIRMLKLLLALLEVSVPPGAFLPIWTSGYRKSWGMKLWSSSSANDLLRILTLLEGAIKKDYLSSNFETTIELLGLIGASQSDAKCSSCMETVSVLPWLPQTTAAIALRLMEFDASILYKLQERANSEKRRSTNGFIFPSKYAVAKSTQHCGSMEDPHQDGLFQEENWTAVGTGLGGLGPGQRSRGHTHGGRTQRRVIGSRSKAIKKKTGTNMNADGLRQMAWKAQPRSQRGHRRGRCSLRIRQKSVKKAVNIVADRNIPKGSNYEDSSRVMVEDEWVGEEKRLQVEGTHNASGSEIFEYDGNGQASGDEYEDLAVNEYACAFNGGPSDLLEESYVNLNGHGEDQDDNNADEDDEQGDIDLEEYINGDSDEKRLKEANVGPKDDPDYGTGSILSDFSD